MHKKNSDGNCKDRFLLQTSLMYLLDYRVHGDVFRPPQKGMLLAVLIGNGVQIGIMSLITLSKDRRFDHGWIVEHDCLFSVFACLGFLSPASRGALMTCKYFHFPFVLFLILVFYRRYCLLCSSWYTCWLHISTIIQE